MWTGESTAPTRILHYKKANETNNPGFGNHFTVTGSVSDNSIAIYSRITSYNVCYTKLLRVRCAWGGVTGKDITVCGYLDIVKFIFVLASGNAAYIKSGNIVTGNGIQNAYLAGRAKSWYDIHALISAYGSVGKTMLGIGTEPWRTVSICRS